MRYYLAIWTLCALTMATAEERTATLATDQLIEQVETGLTLGTRFQGDPLDSIQDRMEHYGVPGVSLAVVKDNRVIWSKAYGVKDRDSGEPVTTDTLFQCASISKPVSAAAALRLVELGQLELDADVNDSLTSWQLPDNEFTAEKKVTLRHLVSHTGGVTNHGFLGYGEGLDVPSLTELLDGQRPANSGATRVDKVPGGSFRYSGGGYCVLQQMMIDATGKSFPEIMNETLLAPLEMSLCTYQQPLPTDRSDEAASGYLPDGSLVSGKRHTYPEMAPAGLYATASQLAQFFIELQRAYHGQSERLLSQAMAQEMMTAIGDSGFGLGIGVKDRAGEIYIGHGGWNEGFSSEATFHRDRGYGVVVLTNSNHPDFVEEIIHSVARAFEWHHYTLPEYKKLSLSDQDIAKLVGRYDHSGSLLTISHTDDQLQIATGANDPKNIYRVGEDTYATHSMRSLIRHATDAATGQSRIHFQRPWDDGPNQYDVARRLADDEKLPSEWLAEGEFDKALAGYIQMKESDPNVPAVQEERLNSIGYELVNHQQLDQAIDIFRINTILYPNAFNTFDSLGEAYLQRGDQELGILNYKKSLELNPENSHAASVIEKWKSQQVE